MRFELSFRAVAVTLGVSCAFASQAFGEYNFQESKPPADGGSERTFLSLPAGSGAEPNAAALSGEFTDFRPAPKRSPEQLAATLQESERLRALNNLERAKALDEELIRVRQMLNEGNRQDERAYVPSAAPVAPVAQELAPAKGMPTVTTASTNRLLAAVQDEDSGRRGERARLELLRESQARKQGRNPSYTRAAGGSKFHAAIEFNSALRGSAAPSNANAFADAAGRRDRLSEAPERPSNRQLFPVEVSESLLLMHKFRSVDLAIGESKGGAVPQERQSQLKGGDPYDSNIKDPLPPLGSSGGGGGGSMLRP